MNWFTRKETYRVCTQCQIHFEPILEAIEEKYKNLCSTHRKEVMEIDRRKERVISWVSRNWEKLK